MGESTGHLLNPSSKLGQRLEGPFVDLSGHPAQLENLADKTLVLIFAQDTCSVCSREADELSVFYSSAGEPKNFRLRHLLVGAVLEDAKDWAQAHKVSWGVGVADREIFLNYCPSHKVPCLLIFKSGEGLVYRKIGFASIEEITKVAGEWP